MHRYLKAKLARQKYVAEQSVFFYKNAYNGKTYSRKQLFDEYSNCGLDAVYSSFDEYLKQTVMSGCYQKVLGKELPF